MIRKVWARLGDYGSEEPDFERDIRGELAIAKCRNGAERTSAELRSNLEGWRVRGVNLSGWNGARNDRDCTGRTVKKDWQIACCCAQFRVYDMTT